MADKTRLRLLLIEDVEDDAALLLRDLDRSGFDVAHRQVDAVDALEDALRSGEKWDVIISDYNLPGFTGVDALGIVRSHDQTTPFIFVSGTMGEDKAVAALRAGAQDYLLKGRIGRLPSVIERELRDARAREEQQVAEKQLRQLSRAVEQSANFVIILDAEGRVGYVNPSFCDSAGYRMDEVVGRRPVFWALSPIVEEEIRSAMLSGRDWHGEIDNIGKDGSRLSVSATISPVTDDDGRLSNVVVIEEDVTRRREIEAQLRQAQKMEAVGNLTGGMAHDFNNLLAVIIGNLDLLCDQHKDNADIQSLAKEALEAAVNGADLTHRLLAFARRQPLDPQRVDVNALIENTVRLLRRMLDPTIEVSFSPGGELWPVVVDPAQLASSITNLATNARDAMPGGGRFSIRTRNAVVDDSEAAAPNAKAGEYVVIEAGDTGTGMPPEIVAHVFEPFFTTKETGKGSGLGLSMVFGFIAQSGGYLTVDSAVGEGTVFRLFLPRNERVAETPVEKVAAKVGADADRKSVLVVEDLAPLRNLVCRQLENLGYLVFEVENAGKALELLERQSVDVLFTDVALGSGSTGFDLARAVAERWPATRIVFTSGFPDDKGSALQTFAARTSMLPKPYRKEDLSRILADILAA